MSTSDPTVVTPAPEVIPDAAPAEPASEAPVATSDPLPEDVPSVGEVAGSTPAGDAPAPVPVVLPPNFYPLPGGNVEMG